MDALKVTAVIVTYNRLELLKEAVQSITNQTYMVSHLIIVNNNSSDGTTNYLNNISNQIDNIIAVNMPDNVGGAGGFYMGIKEFIKTSDDFVWLMDDDTIPANDALENLMIAAQIINYNFGFLCSNVHWVDGTPALMNVPTPSKKWTRYSSKGLIELETCSFVSMMISKSIIKRVGFPIREFFIWGDDLEYSGRISKVAPSYFVTSSAITHKMNANISVNIVDDKFERINRYFYNYRNLFYINRQKGIKKIIKYIYSILKTTALIIKYSKNNKWKRILIMWKGFFSGMFFKPTIEMVA